MTNNAELLYSTIFTTITTKYNDIIPSLEQFEKESEQIRRAFNMLYPVSDDEFVIIKKLIRESILVTIGDVHSLKGIDTTHQSWYRVHKNDGFYWNRYKKYLEVKKKWSPDVMRKLDEATNKIMDDLGDPTQKDKIFNRRGLLLGDVQSGKTAVYTAICNKAADSGYRIIIVLAGMLENLRFQTQERLDAEFAGRESKYVFDKNADQSIRNKAVGVGKIGPFNTNKRIACFTSVSTDFNKAVLKSNDLTLRNLQGTAMFVVKKYKSVLNNLHKWLVENNADDNGKIDLPLLLIDDEADNASVNTKSEDKDPTAINIAIRNILSSFYQTTYLGVTATPFANIFINPEPVNGKPDDLFPRHFLTVLPTPSHYIGAETIFGKGCDDDWHIRSDAQYSSSIVEIHEEEMVNYFKFKHKKELAYELNDLPASLYEALGYFILVTVVRDIKGDENEHASMMVNVSRFTEVQNKIVDIVGSWISDVKKDVEDYACLSVEKAMKIGSIYYLRKIWDKFDFHKKAKHEWKIIQHNFLFNAIKRIEVRAVNQSTGAASLNYYAYKNIGFRVIAIGGNSLSRGLTLEGLCVSYFYRNTMMYDTLMQMGRWFGYRPKYDDLFKIWMSSEAVDWYGYITDAIIELKEELIIMEHQNQTPEEFGLKVRQDPSSLIVTARNKMRTGKLITIPISLSGRLVETPRLKNDREALKCNEKLCIDFINKICRISESPYEEVVSPSAILWRDIEKSYIIDLVKNFSSHPWNLNFQPLALADYISENKNLEIWDIAIPYGGGSSYTFITEKSNVSISTEQRIIIEDEEAHMLRVNGTHLRVGAGRSTRVGLSDEEIRNIEQNIKTLNVDKHENDKIKLTDRSYLIRERKPILLIHVLENKNYKDLSNTNDIPRYIFALSLGFPKIGSDKLANYMVNINEMKKWIDIYETEEDDNEIQ